MRINCGKSTNRIKPGLYGRACDGLATSEKSDAPAPSTAARACCFNQSLEKGLAVLRAFSAQRRTMTLAEVAGGHGHQQEFGAADGLHAGTAGLCAQASADAALPAHAAGDAIGFNYLAADPLIDVANPFLSELTNVTTGDLQPDGAGRARHGLCRPLRQRAVRAVHMPIGSRIPMYCTAPGALT